VRLLYYRVVGPALIAVCAASWLLPGGVPLPGGARLGGTGLAEPGLVHEVAPPLHTGTPWSRYLAPEGTCRGDGSADSPVPQQLFAMRCLLDWARSQRGLPGLPLDLALARSSELKAAAIVLCDDFSHTPCGASFRVTFDAAGWRGSSGENIAWGSSLARSPRILVDGWLHSDGHRENLFDPEWRAQGLALLRSDRFQGAKRAAVWVHQFG
jgi:uncharacterized protein YkwD